MANDTTLPKRTGMERRRFGSTKREVAVIGQGTWDSERGDRASAITALRRGLDLGMTHLDTAEIVRIRSR
jgi:Aldo/keto reductases, related to diketogulonate reductase